VPWEARPVGFGLAGALNGEATVVLNGKTYQYQSVRNIHAPSCAVEQQYSTHPCLSSAEMEASGDYTRVIVRGPNARTVDIFDNHVVGVNSGELSPSAGGGEGAFLRWCHGCSKDLGQGKDIFMYRSVTASLSPEISRVSITTKNRVFSTRWESASSEGSSKCCISKKKDGLNLSFHSLLKYGTACDLIAGGRWLSAATSAAAARWCWMKNSDADIVDFAASIVAISILFSCKL
jgi:hypothetical protein